MRDTLCAGELRGLPEHIHRRILIGMALLRDAEWYRENMGVAGHSELFTVRIAGVLSAGLIWPDIDWLIATGLLVPLSTHIDGCRPEGALSGAELTEQSPVKLTESGHAAFHEATLYPFDTSLSGTDVIAGGARSRLFYCAKRRELWLAEVRVLHLATNADNLEAILVAFQKRHWKRSIACPYQDLSNVQRSRTVRDAVFGLNHGQQPLRVVFHSEGKGARIWHELAHERPPEMQRRVGEIRHRAFGSGGVSNGSAAAARSFRATGGRLNSGKRFANVATAKMDATPSRPD